MSPGGRIVIEDPNPGNQKLQLVADGFLLQNTSGIRAHIVSRLDGKGYDITKRKLICLRCQAWCSVPCNSRPTLCSNWPVSLCQRYSTTLTRR